MKKHKILFQLIPPLLMILNFMFSCDLPPTSRVNPPYPNSPIIESITWDFDNIVRKAPGSDLWPITWGPDNALYTSWGDGGGFGGTNSLGRVSLGFARIEGSSTEFKGVNLWGGKNAYNRAQFSGKSPGIISVDGTLYAWINLQNGNPPDQQLVWSDNLGETWQKANWIFPGNGPFFANSFLNFGKDYLGARDDYVYIYGNDRSNWRFLYLSRVLKDQVKDRNAYDFFIGLDDAGIPAWSSNINLRQPVARDPDGIGAVAIVYNPGIKRYLLTTHHGDYTGRFGFFDAPEPWGPWTTVAYSNDWGGLGKVRGGMPHSFPSKWITDDGKTMWMVFSGTGEYDSFNVIKCTLTLKTSEESRR